MSTYTAMANGLVHLTTLPAGKPIRVMIFGKGTFNIYIQQPLSFSLNDTRCPSTPHPLTHKSLYSSPLLEVMYTQRHPERRELSDQSPIHGSRGAHAPVQDFALRTIVRPSIPSPFTKWRQGVDNMAKSTKYVQQAEMHSARPVWHRLRNIISISGSSTSRLDRIPLLSRPQANRASESH